LSAADNLSIGLFGGSFNPAHAGHMHVAQAGLRELQLDRIWWLLSPQNPLKPKQPNYASRAQTVRELPLLPRMEISMAEQEIGTQYTVDLIRGLRARHARTRFVFLMGADNFQQLPKWKNWREIMETVPIAIIARPQSPIRARLGKAAQIYRDARIPEAHAHELQFFNTPCWTYLTLPLNGLSSSAIRAKQR